MLQKRHLTFAVADSPSGYTRKRLKVTYLKSYTGMGTARVMLCGEFSVLDELFHDHNTFRVSVPEVLMVKISAGDGDRCDRMPAAKRTLQLSTQPMVTRNIVA